MGGAFSESLMMRPVCAWSGQPIPLSPCACKQRHCGRLWKTCFRIRIKWRNWGEDPI